MLALDSTIGCIEASEPDVLDMYRSSCIVTTPVAGSKPESCEAYVCAIRKKSRVQVYFALVAENKRIYVYTKSGEPDTEERYHHTLQEALNFAGSMGFVPERMNLNYSPAMREVVVRNIKILRPPGSKVHALLRHGMADAPTPAGSKKSGALKKHPEPVAATAPAAASPVAETGVSAAPAMVVSPVACAYSVSPPTELPAASHAEPSVAATADAVAVQPARQPDTPATAPRVDVPVATVKLAAASGSPLPSSAAELVQLQGALSRLTQDYKELQRRAAEEITSLREKLAQALSDRLTDQENLASVRAELLENKRTGEKAEDEISGLTRKLASSYADNEVLAAQMQELSAQHLAATAELAHVWEERSRLSAEKQELALRLESVAATSIDLAKLQDELVTVSGRYDEASRDRNELAVENTRRAEAVSGAHDEIRGLIVERDAARRSAEQSRAESGKASEEREALRREVAALAAQRDAVQLRAEASERESQSRGAEMELLRINLAALAVDRESHQEQGGEFQFVAELDQEPRRAGRQAPEPSLPGLGKIEADRDAAVGDAALAEPIAMAPDYRGCPDADDDFFPAGDASGGCPGRFLLQPGMTAIEYTTPADLVELHQSINLAQISPDGKVPGSCQGYICGMATTGGSRQVFVALRDAQSGRTWVYLPEVQPADRSDYASAVAGAVSFAEEVGFIMEPVNLGHESEQRHEAARRCQVLQCTGRE